MEIRTLQPDEAGEHIRMMQYAFGRYVSEAPKEEHLAAEPTGPVWAAIDGTTIASCLTVHSFTHSVRGSEQPVGGIGGVATRPEYRGQGLVTKLLTRSFLQMHEEGTPFSMLRPFKEAFYRRYGYAATNGAIDYTFDCRNFGQFSRSGDGYSIDVTPAEGQREQYFTVMREHFHGVHGRILSHEQSAAEWKKRVENRLFILISRAGVPAAMGTFAKDGFLSAGTLEFRDVFWSNAEAREALFSYIARHQDQISRVTMTLPYDTNVHELIPNAEGKIEAGYRGAPWMVRVISAREALAGIPVDAPVEAVVRVRDEFCEWNNCTLEIATEGNTIVCRDSDQEPDITLGVAALSALIYGAVDGNTCERVYRPQIATRETWRDLCSALPRRTVFNDYWF